MLLEMDDVMEGGDEEHETFMTDIASKITFGEIKEVRQFDEGVLFNGGRWFQDERLWDITFQVTDYIRNRIGPVKLVKTKKSKADQPQLSTLEVRTAEPAWCCRTTLPHGTQWHDVIRRQVCDMDGKEIEPWTEIRGATTDELHRPLEEYGLGPQRLLIRYEVDQDKQKLNKRALDEEEQTQLRVQSQDSTGPPGKGDQMRRRRHQWWRRLFQTPPLQTPERRTTPSRG